MSVTYSIACRDCKESLWIGQTDYLYFGEKDFEKKLTGFLYKHSGNSHSLIFLNDFGFDQFSENGIYFEEYQANNENLHNSSSQK